MVTLRISLLVLCIINVCIIYIRAYDDGFEDHVDMILNGMADEDGVGSYGDPYEVDANLHTTSRGRGLIGLTELQSTRDIESFLSSDPDKPAVIGYFDLTASSSEFFIFEKLGNRDNEHYRYGYTTNKLVLEERRYNGCTVVVHMAARFLNPSDDKPRVRYPNKKISDIAALKTFVRQKAVPLVGEMTAANEKLYRNTRLPVVTVFALIDHLKNPKGFKYLLNRVRKVAKLFKGKLNFNIADARRYFKDMSQKYEFEHTYTEHPVSVGLRDDTVYYAMPQGEFSVDTLSRFVQDFEAKQFDGNEQFDGFLNKDEDDPVDSTTTQFPTKKTKRASTKSTETQSDSQSHWEGSEVVELSDSNAHDLIHTPNVDVFLEFYAPWCGHCQKLAPELRKTAKAFKEDDGIVVAAMDVTANTVPSGFQVSGYPALFFIPASDKEHPVVYRGGRQASDLIEYITLHRTIPVHRGGELSSAENNKLKNVDEL